jgi:hypothetical protein
MSDENKNLYENAENDDVAVQPEVIDTTEETSAASGLGAFRRKLKFGGYSVALIIAFIVGVVLLNIAFSMLLDRFNLRFDLTERQLYSIERSTVDYLSSLDDTINFYFCSREENFTNRGDTFSQVYEIAQRFSEANRSFTITFVDRLTNPAFVTKYGGNLRDSDIVVESERTGRYKVVSESDYFIYDFFFNGERITEQQANEAFMWGFGEMVEWDISAGTEQAFLSAIMSVSDMTPVRVAFANGFGEIAYEDMMTLLERNGYMVEEIDLLMAAEIDPEIDFLVICSPEFDYTENARSKIDAWLDNGGMYNKTLLYLPPGAMPDMPVLDELMEEWGIVVENGFVSQSNPNFALPQDEWGFTQFLRMVGGPFSEGIDERSVLAMAIRPVALLFGVQGHTSTSSLLVSYEGSFYFPLDWGEDGIPEGWQPVAQLLNAAVMSSKSRFDGLDRFTSRVIVFGSPTFFHSTYLEDPRLSNARVLLNIFNDVSGRSDIGALIMPKSFRSTRFEITAGQANSIAVVFVFVLPLLIIITGLVVFFRRRYK